MSMKHPDLDYMIMMEHHREMLEEAARSRLLKEARIANREYNQQIAGPVARPNLLVLKKSITRASEELMLALARFLSFAGGRLLAWSCRLQTHYEMLLADNPQHRPASPCM